jgi:hypothetical protein
MRRAAWLGWLLWCTAACDPTGDALATDTAGQTTPGTNRCQGFLAVCTVDALSWCDENLGKRSVNCADFGARCREGACQRSCVGFVDRCSGTTLVTCRNDGMLQFDDCLTYGPGHTCGSTADYPAACLAP